MMKCEMLFRINFQNYISDFKGLSEIVPCEMMNCEILFRYQLLKY